MKGCPCHFINEKCKKRKSCRVWFHLHCKKKVKEKDNSIFCLFKYKIRVEDMLGYTLKH